MASTGKMQGKVALVTGGSGGIGTQVCLNFASQGASLVIVDMVSADELTSKIAASGGKAISVKADISKSADITAAFDKAVEAFGTVHIVVHLAGIMLNGSTIPTTTEEEWDRIFSINAKGAFLVAKEAANRLGPGGRIVLTSSLLAERPMVGFGPYSCTKAVVEVLVKVLAKELTGRKITINAIAPGPVKTPMLLQTKTPEMLDELVKACPLGRLGEAKDIAHSIQFLVSDEAEWVNAQILAVGGGLQP
ncbi:unnamed protein product [Calypogeia fissa]